MLIKLRKIKPSDLKYFLKWWKDKDIIKLTSGIYKNDNNKLKQYFQQMLENKNDHHFLIIYDKKTIGHLAICAKDKKTFEINIVIGAKKLWGQGLGTLAIKQALNKVFFKHTYERGYLEVRPDNKRAIQAYLNSGWEKSGYKYYKKKNYQRFSK